jgi:hypothetical protein
VSKRKFRNFSQTAATGALPADGARLMSGPQQAIAAAPKRRLDDAAAIAFDCQIA